MPTEDRPSATGHDVSRQVAPHYDPLRHTLTIADVEAQLFAAGVPRTRRTVQRLCSNGSFDAAPLGSNDEWYVAPDSVPKVIGDLRANDEQRARRAATHRDVTHHVASEITNQSASDTSRHDATQRDTSPAPTKQELAATGSDTSRHGASDYDIYEHPYVKRLEAQVDKLEKKYDDQIRRTEEIQINSQKQILELQRMTAIGQSQTLADFMLKAKDWILGQGTDMDKKEVASSPNAA